MKKIISLALSLSITLANTVPAFANVGDMGFFGGISEGRRLPKTTEEMLESEGTTSKSSGSSTPIFEYKEVVFLGGEPTEFEGTLTVKSNGSNIDFMEETTGSYKETFTIKSNSSESEADVNRNITFDVNYYVKGTQVIKDYTASNWTETISGTGGSYTLDNNANNQYNISIIEDHTPGVTYYKGDISSRGTYTDGTVQYLEGSFYGYNCAYSSTETHRLNGTIEYGDGSGQTQYQVRPSVTVDKTMVYDENEPFLTSFEGNYKEVISNESGLLYNIFITPTEHYSAVTQGQSVIDTFNTFEQLIAPDTSYLKGNFAEYDIKKLFAMSILDGDTKHYVPSQAITRGEYVEMLVKAIKLDTSKYDGGAGTVSNPTIIVFPDVPPTRDDYKYIMAGYESGLAIGRQNGHYFPDSPITREEAFVILLRTLGLTNLGLDSTPVTVFTDDDKISDWARKEIYAAQRIGLITGDEYGKVNPQSYVSKAEASALVNRLIDYMRIDLQADYGRNIVNFAD